ncbi:DUF1501 domain-containing protein [Labilibacter marinus]|uniref:DUF1501 domain-containing protein n=1 Tax=Labilibacter marinus TaxID=1477105 RepID=UPI00083641B1|nr:DUF1501 domain-containing protein [Labilibacter marinus]
MDRRAFLKHSVVASSALMVPQFLQGINQSDVSFNGKRLIVVQLAGGNDGLNTIVPYRNDIYYKQRPTISIKPSEVLGINSELGMHPSLKNTASLFENGEMTIFNQVGYPNQNKSHFRATDIWLTASDANKYYSSGWLGKYLDAECNAPHSAIEIGTSMSLALKGKKGLGMAFTNPAELKRVGNTSFFNALNKVNHQGNETLGYLYKTFNNTKSSTDYLFDKYKTYKTNVDYPNSELARSLKTIASLIGSGVETPVYYASMSGFDTHSNQQNKQKQLLSTLDSSLSSLVKDLKQTGNYENTLILVFSEFGRRINENGSKGTDHGKANNVWLLGGNLNKPGFANNTTNLNLQDEKDLLHTLDFREIYSSILKNWLGSNQAIIEGKFKSFKV